MWSRCRQQPEGALLIAVGMLAESLLTIMTAVEACRASTRARSASPGQAAGRRTAAGRASIRESNRLIPKYLL